MAYVSLYRKYRSQTFGDLVGQDHVVRTLQSAIQSGRIAHSYLFTGPRGTGKTSSARLLAKALCCETGPSVEPCNTCAICVSIGDGSALDVFEFDAASESGVDEVRETIVDVAEYAPAVARYKVFIIDEVHDLSPKAFDALLKTIEEPPAHVIFILATTEYNKVPPTIRSRCQKFEFHRASMADLVARLEHVVKQESIVAEPAALTAIARMADGGFRDALTLLEQAILTAEGPVTLEEVYAQLGLIGEESADQLLLAIRHGQVPTIVELVTELTRRGRDPRSILESLLYRLADLTRAAYGLDLAETDASRSATLHNTAVQLGQRELLAIRSELAEAHKVIRDISLPRLWLESELIRIGQVVTDKPKPVVAKPAASAPTPTVAPPKPAVEAERPKPVERASEPVVPKERQPAAASGNPELDRAVDLWHKAYDELASVSNLMKNKLEKTKIVAVDGDTFTLSFVNRVELEWVTESPKRQAAIQDVFRKHAGADANLKMISGPPVKMSQESVAVELPLEGKALHDAATDILRG